MLLLCCHLYNCDSVFPLGEINGKSGMGPEMVLCNVGERSQGRAEPGHPGFTVGVHWKRKGPAGQGGEKGVSSGPGAERSSLELKGVASWGVRITESLQRCQLTKNCVTLGSS